jgi:hypothetical protein
MMSRKQLSLHCLTIFCLIAVIGTFCAFFRPLPHPLTINGIKLGLSRKQVEELCGRENEIRDGFFVYSTRATKGYPAVVYYEEEKVVAIIGGRVERSGNLFLYEMPREPLENVLGPPNSVLHSDGTFQAFSSPCDSCCYRYSSLELTVWYSGLNDRSIQFVLERGAVPSYSPGNMAWSIPRRDRRAQKNSEEQNGGLRPTPSAYSNASLMRFRLAKSVNPDVYTKQNRKYSAWLQL